MPVYLSYDVRGIQRFIFAIPKLRAIIGGSAAIDQLDVLVRERFAKERVFAGGGRGLLIVEDKEAAVAIESKLCNLAAEDGLDLQIGIDEHLFKSMEQADRMHTFVPQSLVGDPCEVSALYPVETTGKPHPIVQKRLNLGRRDALGTQLLTELNAQIEIPDKWPYARPRFVFFRDVNPDEAAEFNNVDEEYDLNDESHATCGKAAIGGRNRWAIVATDVNGLGEQFSHAKEQFAENDQFVEWLRRMSDAVSKSVRDALKCALVDVINQWLRDNNDNEKLKRFCYQENGSMTLVLPFRPLICGGDDILLLCHPSYAITIARELCRSVNARCTDSGRSIPNLWPATGNVGPTMSAGVLFCTTSMPLASAIDYAQSLLSNAKSVYRKTKPMPAAIDFEMVTESLLDTPAERRRRELEFVDDDTNLSMRLHNRPYLLEGSGPESLDEAFRTKDEVIEKLPRSLALELLSKMHKPWSERFEFLSSVSKRHPMLFEMFTTMDSETPGKAWVEKTNPSGNAKVYSTCLADAISLFEEDARMDRRGPANRRGN